MRNDLKIVCLLYLHVAIDKLQKTQFLNHFSLLYCILKILNILKITLFQLNKHTHYYNNQRIV